MRRCPEAVIFGSDTTRGMFATRSRASSSCRRSSGSTRCSARVPTRSPRCRARSRSPTSWSRACRGSPTTATKGGYRSRIEVNADLPVSIVLLVAIAAHESYPGHHTERAAKEARLTRALGRVETSVVVTSTPESLVSEGLAQHALGAALGPTPYEVVADALAEHGGPVRPDRGPGHPRGGARPLRTGDERRVHDLRGRRARGRGRRFPADMGPRIRGTLGSHRPLRRPTRRLGHTCPPIPRVVASAAPSRHGAPGNFSRLLTEQLTTADLLD